METTVHGSLYTPFSAYPQCFLFVTTLTAA